MSCAEEGRDVGTKGRKAGFIGEQVSEGRRQRGEECSQGNHGAKEGGMDG